jgi:hypothetical protein
VLKLRSHLQALHTQQEDNRLDDCHTKYGFKEIKTQGSPSGREQSTHVYHIRDIYIDSIHKR